MKSAWRIIAIIAAVVLIGFAADALYNGIVGINADLKAMREADAKAHAVIAEKDADNARLMDTIAALREQDAESQLVEARLRSDLAAATAESDRLRNELKTAPPESILASTKRWLASDEVWLRNNAASQVEAVFSLSAFRLNADALAEREYLKFTLAPSLTKQLAESEKQGALKDAVIAGQSVIIGNKDDIIGVMNGQILSRDAVIKTIKRKNVWRTLAYIGGGVIVGFAIAK